MKSQSYVHLTLFNRFEEGQNLQVAESGFALLITVDCIASIQHPNPNLV